MGSRVGVAVAALVGVGKGAAVGAVVGASPPPQAMARIACMANTRDRALAFLNMSYQIIFLPFADADSAEVSSAGTFDGTNTSGTLSSDGWLLSNYPDTGTNHAAATVVEL